jgi:hypothetical protein
MDFVASVDDVEIVLTQNVNVVSGTVTNRSGGPVGAVTVIVFADDPQRWGPRSRYVGTGRSNTSGTFTIRGLPPGRYRAIAVDFLESGDERDPEILQTLRGKAAPLTLGDGETKTLDLKLTQE